MKFWMLPASSWNVVEVVRPQPGQAATLRGATVSADFKQMVIDYIERRWGAGTRTAAE